MRLNKLLFDAILLEILQQHQIFFFVASFNRTDLLYLFSSDFGFFAYFNNTDFSVLHISIAIHYDQCLLVYSIDRINANREELVGQYYTHSRHKWNDSHIKRTVHSNDLMN